MPDAVAAGTAVAAESGGLVAMRWLYHQPPGHTFTTNDVVALFDDVLEDSTNHLQKARNFCLRLADLELSICVKPGAGRRPTVYQLNREYWRSSVTALANYALDIDEMQ